MASSAIRVALVWAVCGSFVVAIGLFTMFATSLTSAIDSQPLKAKSRVQPIGAVIDSTFRLLLVEKAYAFTILTCGRVCTDPEGCECQCNGENYNLAVGFACD